MDYYNNMLHASATLRRAAHPSGVFRITSDGLRGGESSRHHPPAGAFGALRKELSTIPLRTSGVFDGLRALLPATTAAYTQLCV